MAYADPHIGYIRPVSPRTPGACEDCLATGTPWLHLRMCRTCGKVSAVGTPPRRGTPMRTRREWSPDRALVRAW